MILLDGSGCSVRLTGVPGHSDSCAGAEGQHQVISVSKPSPDCSLFNLSFPEFEKPVDWKGKKSLEHELWYGGMDAASGFGVPIVSW